MKTRRGWLVKRGRTFYATWEVSGKRFQKTTGQTDRRKAETRLAEIMRPFLVEDEARTLESVKARIEGARAELAAIDEERNPPLTIRQAWPAYLATPNRPDTGQSTLVKHEGKVSRFVSWIGKAHPEATTMRDVTEEHAEAYAQNLIASGMAPATFNAHVGLLRLVWRVLLKKARTDRNPWQEIGKKRVASTGRRELTLAELRTICEQAAGELRTMLAVGLYSGLRLGDCATLRWAEADLDAGMIRRVPMKTARRNPKPVQMPMHPTLRALLIEARGAENGSEYVLPDTAALYLRDPSAVCKRVQAHFVNCGICTHRPGTGGDTGKRAAVEVGFHSLRHSFVSLCRASDVPLAVVEALVSHASPAVTRLYSHTGADAAAAAVATLPAVLGNEPKALPLARQVDAATVRAIAEGLNGTTWETTRAALMTLTDPTRN